MSGLTSPAIAEESLCEWLCKHTSLDSDEIERARRLISSQQQGELFSYLLRLGTLSEQDLVTGWAEVLCIPKFFEAELTADYELLVGVNERFIRHHCVLPLKKGEDVWLLMANPCNENAIKAISYAIQQTPKIAVCSPSLIGTKLDALLGVEPAPMSSLLDADEVASEGLEDIEHLKDMASEAPVIRMVNLLLQRAVEQRASDIHIEPFERTLMVRFRIDGILHDIDAPPARSAAAVISRIKIMARLDIAERRLPQDGRIMLKVQGKALDLRVSTIPTSFGESIVLRLLDRSDIQLDFPTLGFSGPHLQRFVQLLNAPHGIILVTGPTGSGKTTTLYTALSRLNETERKIISVEDPVEYQLQGINQVQVKPSIGLDFPQALRAIMRQDPDVIMIGEMRDLATCRIAIQASLTGHLVLSTLHTNSAAESITRLLDMGAESYLLASTLRGVLAQRLVRKLDPATRIPYTPSSETIRDLGLDALSGDAPVTLYRADPNAAGGGYRGRSAITELLIFDETIRDLLATGVDAHSLETAARQQPTFQTLREDGLRQALAGITSLEEVSRVTGLDQ